MCFCNSLVQDIFAAHSAYLCAGAYPTFPTSAATGAATGAVTGTAGANLRNTSCGHASTFSSNDSLPSLDQHNRSSAELETQAGKFAGKYSLLGCDISQPKHRALTDCMSISALRGTEILEFTLHKRLAAQVAAASMGKATPSADGIASFGKSLTDIFSWKGSGGGSAGAGGNVPPKSPHHGAHSTFSSAPSAGGGGGSGTGTGSGKNKPSTTMGTAKSYASSKHNTVRDPSPHSVRHHSEDSDNESKSKKVDHLSTPQK